VFVCVCLQIDDVEAMERGTGEGESCCTDLHTRESSVNVFLLLEGFFVRRTIQHVSR
jgi:hypothetical protein